MNEQTSNFLILLTIILAIIVNNLDLFHNLETGFNLFVIVFLIGMIAFRIIKYTKYKNE